jgi:hypothetical protein
MRTNREKKWRHFVVLFVRMRTCVHKCVRLRYLRKYEVRMTVVSSPDILLFRSREPKAQVAGLLVNRTVACEIWDQQFCGLKANIWMLMLCLRDYLGEKHQETSYKTSET